MDTSIVSHAKSRAVSAFKPVVVSLALATTLGVSGSASAELVKLQWNTTVLSSFGLHPAISGEDITTTILVDNGTTGVDNKTWEISDFQSYHVAGASGWSFTSYDINTGSSAGAFTTDGAGAVLTVGQWRLLFGAVEASWSTDLKGGWFNNGGNQIHHTVNTSTGVIVDSVWATDVATNQHGSAWTATTVAAVPEPSTYAMMAIGLLGIAGLRRRQNKA